MYAYLRKQRRVQLIASQQFVIRWKCRFGEGAWFSPSVPSGRLTELSAFCKIILFQIWLWIALGSLFRNPTSFAYSLPSCRFTNFFLWIHNYLHSFSYYNVLFLGVNFVDLYARWSTAVLFACVRHVRQLVEELVNFFLILLM